MINNFDELISEKDEDFKRNGIIKESTIRLGFLAVVSTSTLAGTIGEDSEQRHQKLLKRLSDYLFRK